MVRCQVASSGCKCMLGCNGATFLRIIVYILRNYFFRQPISYMLAAKLTVSVCAQI